jgi:Zn-finger nucleic acid-binding protein
MSEMRLADVNVAVDVCGVCRGVWFDWFDGETSALARHLDTEAVTAPPSVPGGCPRDGSVLETRPYLDTGPPVHRCPTCLGLFAPRAQIAALQAFHEGMPQTKHEPIERTSLLQRLWHAFVD